MDSFGRGFAYFLFALLALGCRAAPSGQGKGESARVADSPPPTGRLGEEVAPLRYQLEMRLDPRKSSFSARVAIDLEVRRPVRTIWLHGAGLEVIEAALERGGARHAAEATVGPHGSDLVGFSTGRSIAAGRARLEIEYRGELGRERGLFRQKTGGRWYAFTDFEAVDARRALFCFDEPAFKTPWEIALEIPREMEGFSNAPLASETPQEGGQKRLEFEPTPPLPSYLVAFAAGPFDVAEGPEQPLPFRAITPRGRGDDAALALKSAPPLTEILEEYLGSKVPFPKLDFLAIPRLDGAMENPGLITFSESILLTRERDGESRRRFLVGVMAHELAHLWFGDLVTPTWWNDLWLNEAFATWLSDVAVARYWPERKGRLLEVTDRRTAVRADRRLGAPPVRREIGRASQVRGAFHAITYRKGGAVLDMLARYLGEERLKRGLRRYLEAHSGGSATTKDLARALSAAAERDLAPAIRSFVDRPGIPLVRADLRCEEGGAHLALSQNRLLGAFDAARADPAERRQRWHIPVCARFAAGGETAEQACTMLAARQGRLELGRACPAWVHPNPGGAGYYHWWMPPDELRALLDGPRMSEREVVDLLLSAEALLAAGEFGVEDVFTIYTALADRDEAAIAEVIRDTLELLSRSVVTPALRPAFAARIRRLYGERARRLGVVADRRESEEVRALRWNLVRLVGDLGEDPLLRRRARERAGAWLASGATIRSETDLLALRLAARGADEALFDDLLAAFRRTSSTGRKMALATALGSTSDPALVRRALELVLAGSLDRTAPALLFAALENARSRPIALELLRERHDELARRLEGGVPGRLLALLCSEEAARAVRSWRGSSEAAPAAEEIARCAAFAERQRESAKRYFGE